MKILYCVSECVPFVKTGGLADVAGSLPVALRNLGADVRVVLPKYRIIDDYWKSRMRHMCDFLILFGQEHVFVGVEEIVDNGVTYYFIDNEDYFYGDNIYGDGIAEGWRFAFFSRAVLEILPKIGFFPDILHLNDWQTGLTAALLRTQYAHRKEYARMRTVFSIHNLRYQGVFDWMALNGRLGLDSALFTPACLEFYGNANCMKAGIVFSDRISTVSPTYANEILTEYYGERLDGLLRARGDGVTGILNGIDTVVFDPGTDRFLTAHYTDADRSGKAACKKLLQRECGLAEDADAPLVGLIARLSAQKGLDLIERVLTDILKKRVQLVFLGAGDKHFADFLSWAEWRYPRRVAFRSGLNEGLAHRIYAGADLFLMPSQFEPCGLSQMIAMRYGTVPIVRETGGLRDTVRPYNRFTGEGDGFSFSNYNAHEMLNAIERAADLYAGNREAFEGLIASGMAKDFSWAVSAAEYLRMYDLLLPKARPAAVPRPAHEKAEAKEAETGAKRTRGKAGDMRTEG